MPAIVKLSEIEDNTRFVIFPATPPEVPNSGEAVARSFTIDGAGSYSFPAGRAEKKFPLSGTFPGPGRAHLSHVHDWRPPIDLVRQVTNWCDDNVWLTLLYDTAAENNSWSVYVSRYQFTRAGGYGDVSFSIELTELRQAVVMIDTIPTPSSTDAQNTTPTQAEATIAEGSTTSDTDNGIPPNYMVQPGDSLSLIARKVLGDSGRWKEIWEMNPITDPNMIYPGLVLLMPGATTVRTDLPSDLLPQPERPANSTSGSF